MVAAVLVATTILGAWTYLVVSYDSPLGTDNVVVIEQTSTSNGSSDVLASLSLEEGALVAAGTTLRKNLLKEEIYYG